VSWPVPLTAERFFSVTEICRQAGTVSKRATVYFDPSLHRALRIKAAETETSVSDLVNEAVRASLSEDASDLEAFEVREAEPDYAFEDVVKELKRRGKI
jgi:hypothetical protein